MTSSSAAQPRIWQVVGHCYAMASILRLSSALASMGVTFLGCRLERRSVRLKSGRLATVQVYNMQPFLETCVQRYLELAPKGATLKPASTPFINESALETTAGKPADVGEVAECPWCCHTFKPEIHPDIRALEVAARKQRRSGQAPLGVPPHHHQGR